MLPIPSSFLDEGFHFPFFFLKYYVITLVEAPLLPQQDPRCNLEKIGSPFSPEDLSDEQMVSPHRAKVPSPFLQSLLVLIFPAPVDDKEVFYSFQIEVIPFFLSGSRDLTLSDKSPLRGKIHHLLFSNLPAPLLAPTSSVEGFKG